MAKPKMVVSFRVARMMISVGVGVSEEFFYENLWDKKLGAYK